MHREQLTDTELSRNWVATGSHLQVPVTVHAYLAIEQNCQILIDCNLMAFYEQQTLILMA
jgi:hypothetical protein